MRSARIAVATAVAAAALLVAAPAHARHTCPLDEVNHAVDRICEWHVEDIRQILCLLSPVC